ncbi:MAG TPA: hypothetical protein VK970_00570 [Candidatus Methylacidiphilales bacterium]|nr:hypothetical protein [Candidatus Methylacidiphilales bacterium]
MDLQTQQQNLEPHIKQCLEIMREFPDAEDQDIANRLMQHLPEGEEETAYQLVEFVPMAYARTFFAQDGVQFDDRYCRRLEPGGVSHCCFLGKEPVWRAAMAYARAEIKALSTAAGEDLVEKFSVIFLRCEVAKPLWDRVGNGEDISGGRVYPPVLQRLAVMPCPTPAPLPNTSLMNAVRRGTELLYQQDDAGWADTTGLHLKIAEAIGGDAELAWQILEFVPEGFAAMTLGPELPRLNPTFQRMQADGSLTHECPLSAEPVWNMALMLARYEETQRFAIPRIYPLLIRSLTLRVVNEQSADGSELSEVRIVLERDAPMPCPAPDSSDLESIFGDDE